MDCLEVPCAFKFHIDDLLQGRLIQLLCAMNPNQASLPAPARPRDAPISIDFTDRVTKRGRPLLDSQRQQLRANPHGTGRTDPVPQTERGLVDRKADKLVGLACRIGLEISQGLAAGGVFADLKDGVLVGGRQVL
jgi:hypothetical protein